MTQQHRRSMHKVPLFVLATIKGAAQTFDHRTQIESIGVLMGYLERHRRRIAARIRNPMMLSAEWLYFRVVPIVDLPSSDAPCLSVVMPAYNEQDTIARIAAEVLASPFTRELIIIDDASTDDTVNVVKSIDDPRVRLLRQEVNQGKGAAIRRGFSEATSSFVIVQDADLEYSPNDYVQIVEPLVQGRADVVFGSRFISGQSHRVLYYWHSVGNRFLTTLSNMFTNLNLTDMETCYKAFRREVLDSFVLEEARFGIEPEMTAKVARGGWRVYEVGISYDGRTYDEGKKIGWRDGVRAVYCILLYSSVGPKLRLRRAEPAVRWLTKARA